MWFGCWFVADWSDICGLWLVINSVAQCGSCIHICPFKIGLIFVALVYIALLLVLLFRFAVLGLLVFAWAWVDVGLVVMFWLFGGGLGLSFLWCFYWCLLSADACLLIWWWFV